jgi:hypothetical protein
MSDAKIVNLPQWLEPEAAAAALGISYRTLRDRAQRGEIARRRDGRCVLYRVAIVAPDTGTPLAIANVKVAKVAKVAPDTGTAAELVTALVSAVDRAARAEARVESLTAEAERLRAQVRELEADLHLTTTDLRAVNARVERIMGHWQDALRARRAR